MDVSVHVFRSLAHSLFSAILRCFFQNLTNLKDHSVSVCCFYFPPLLTFHYHHYQNMSSTEPQPSPPFLSDLCLLAVLKAMSVANRISASKVCPRWRHQVREVNQAVRSLTIAIGERDVEWVEGWINNFWMEYEPSVRLLKKEDGESPLYPLHRLTKWNCLLCGEGALDSATVKTIIAALPAVTELTFVSRSYGEEYQHLVEMLQSPSVWRGQLTTLKLIDKQRYGSRHTAPLFTAINGLTSLRRLTLDLLFLGLRGLPILSQLEELRFRDCRGEQYRLLFLSLGQYVSPSGKPLLVDLADYSGRLNQITDLVVRLTSQVRFTRLRAEPFRLSTVNLSPFAFFFSDLTSLKFRLSPSDCHWLFDVLSTLDWLEHLSLEIDFRDPFHCPDSSSEEEEGGVNAVRQPIRRPMEDTSVRAVDLNLTITSHADLEWLNLPGTMPVLKAIYLHLYCCECETEPSGQSSATDQCLLAVYEILQRTDLPPSQIAFNRDGKVCTMEELLNKDEPSS